MAEQAVQNKLEWEIRDYSAGLVDKIDDNLIPANAARDCRNVISLETGRLSVRKGQVRLNDTRIGVSPINGLYSFYDSEDTRKIVAASAGSVYVWNSSQGFAAVKSGLDASADVMFETCATETTGRTTMVAFNGVDNPVKWSGSGSMVALEGFPLPNYLTEKFKYPTFHHGQLFVTGVKHPSFLFVSEQYNAEEWPSDYIIQVKQGDGDGITCLRPFMGELTIFKRRSIHSLRGTSPDDFRLDELDSKIGCVGPKAACLVGSKIFFVSDEGIYIYNGMTAKNISNDLIPELWGGVNKTYLHKAAATYWNGQVWFSVPYGDSTVNNMVIVYCLTGDGGGVFWPMDSINADTFSVFNDGTSLKLYTGDAVAGYVNQQDIGSSDFGGNIEAYWIGRAWDNNDPYREKKAKKAFVEGIYSQTDQMSMLLQLNYGDFTALSLKAFDGLVSEFLFPAELRIKWRYLTPQFYYKGKNPCEVRGMKVPYKSKQKPRVSSGV